MEKQEYLITTPELLNTLLKQVGKFFKVIEAKPQKIHETYYDTFDWLLYGKGKVLKRRGKSFYLYQAKDGSCVEGTALMRKQFFYWDLEEGGLKNELRDLTDIRALMELVTTRSVRKRYALLNRDRKTVVRLYVDNVTAGTDGAGSDLPPLVRVEGVRGYEKAFSKVMQIFDKEEIEGLPNGHFRFKLALQECGIIPLGYSSKYDLSLLQSVTVRDAVSEICCYLICAMENNFDGVIKDIDSEFLHDFRIAIRRTRSLISQLKKGLPAANNNFFLNEFKWLGSITGPVRDIDVYLLMKDEYRQMLPRELHEGLEYFYQDLEGRRKSALQDMKKGLTSERYCRLMNQWKDFLDTGKEADEWPQGDRLCKDTVVKVIRKRFKRIITDGRAIKEDSPDEELHRLRIQGKKLRYLLEFFKSFYDEKEIDFFLKQLKKLQNNLGDFNDLSVQQEMLLAHQKKLVPRSKRSVSIASAIGGLLTHLGDQHGSVRLKFQSTFADFASDQNTRRFSETLFK